MCPLPTPSEEALLAHVWLCVTIAAPPKWLRLSWFPYVLQPGSLEARDGLSPTNSHETRRCSGLHKEAALNTEVFAAEYRGSILSKRCVGEINRPLGASLSTGHCSTAWPSASDGRRTPLTIHSSCSCLCPCLAKQIKATHTGEEKKRHGPGKWPVKQISKPADPIYLF